MNKQTVTMEERLLAMGITPTCSSAKAARTNRVVPQGGVHLDDCPNCFRHCQCQRSRRFEGAQ